MAAEAAGLGTWVSPHTLRHSFAIRHYGLLAGTAKAEMVAKARELLVGARNRAGRRPGRCDGARSAVPLLRRAHAHHRDLRARCPPEPLLVGACGCHQDRHVMSTTDLTYTVALPASWSATSCDDARAMERRTPHSAPRSWLSRIAMLLRPVETRSPTAAIDAHRPRSRPTHPDRRGQIPIAPAAPSLPTSRGFFPWRLSDTGPRCTWQLSPAPWCLLRRPPLKLDKHQCNAHNLLLMVAVTTARVPHSIRTIAPLSPKFRFDFSVLPPHSFPTVAMLAGNRALICLQLFGGCQCSSRLLRRPAFAPPPQPKRGRPDYPDRRSLHLIAGATVEIDTPLGTRLPIRYAVDGQLLRPGARSCVLSWR